MDQWTGENFIRHCKNSTSQFTVTKRNREDNLIRYHEIESKL